MLFSNIEITGSILAFTLINLAKNCAFQRKLLEEIRAKEEVRGYDVEEYVARQDTLLHYATLESIRVTPAMCMFLFLLFSLLYSSVISSFFIYSIYRMVPLPNCPAPLSSPSSHPLSQYQPPQAPTPNNPPRQQANKNVMEKGSHHQSAPPSPKQSAATKSHPTRL
jgi:hypothetical protein